jgi:hypothetical protein
MGVSGQHDAPGKGPPVPIVQEAGWAPEPVRMQRLEDKSSTSVRDRTPVVQSVVIHYTERHFYSVFLQSNHALLFNKNMWSEVPVAS